MSDIRMTEREREAFLAEPRVAVLSVANDAGRPPFTAPIWYACEPGGDLTFYTKWSPGRPARKTGLITRAGGVSVCVQHPEPPYTYVTVEGNVTLSGRLPTESEMLAIVRRYLPDEEARGFVAADRAGAGPKLVLFTVHPNRWLTADFAKLG